MKSRFMTVGGTVEPVPGTKMYIAVISSTQELPDLEKLNQFDPSIPIIFFNLRLDVLVRQSFHVFECNTPV